MNASTPHDPARPGIFRRRLLVTTAPGLARADVEDDAHRFGVLVRHDDRRVTSVEGRAWRTPRTLCRGALAVLDRLVGMPLSPNPVDAYRHTKSTEQCTHLFDLAALAIAHSARGTVRRQYDVDIPVHDMTSPRVATLRRDGKVVLTWTVSDRTHILGPDIFAGRDIRTVLTWAESGLPALDDYEAVFVMRRAWLVSVSREIDQDRFPRADSPLHAKIGACFVYQHGVVEHATRSWGATLDFTGALERMLEDLDAS
jgi:hypothetical protein